MHKSCTRLNCRACSHGQVRLLNGDSTSDGALQLCLAGRWSYVCSDSDTSHQEAMVACQQLNCDSGEYMLYTAHIGRLRLLICKKIQQHFFSGKKY